MVADGTSEIVIDTLGPDWQLEAREFFYRKTIETADVRRIYRSARDSRLMVIDKAAAGPSDALNCGVNVARYRYVMSVAPEVIFDRDALLRVMTAALRDPANVIGASSHVERGDVSSVRLVAGIRPVRRASAPFDRTRPRSLRSSSGWRRRDRSWTAASPGVISGPGWVRRARDRLASRRGHQAAWVFDDGRGSGSRHDVPFANAWRGRRRAIRPRDGCVRPGRTAAAAQRIEDVGATAGSGAGGPGRVASRPRSPARSQDARVFRPERARDAAGPGLDRSRHARRRRSGLVLVDGGTSWPSPGCRWEMRP